MRAPFRILDADRHVMEPIDLWKEHLPPDLQKYAPYIEPTPTEGSVEERVRLYGPKALFPLAPTLMFDGKPVWHDLSQRAQVEMSWSSLQRRAETAAVADPVGHLDSMDRAGIDTAFLYPTLSLYVLGIDVLPSELGAAFATAYNGWLRDYCARDPARLRGVGLISTHDPALMAAEVERVAGFGWTSVVILPNPIMGRRLSDPSHDAFWATCERLSVAVSIHVGTHTRLPTAGADRFQSHFALHACAHPMEQMIALLTLIEGGILERHPNLRVAFLEAGCGWLPYWLYRLDEIEYAHSLPEVKNTVKRKPSEYFKRQCFVAIEPDEPYLATFVDSLGADNLFFGTDFPHSDHGDDIVDKGVGLTKVLPHDVVQKILWDNAARFYRVEDSGTP